ncbi:MAG TPA: polysaccharide deacetylase family protein [bacterium]|nr:polysaccharide deacetylase family protein [bacterium]
MSPPREEPRRRADRGAQGARGGLCVLTFHRVVEACERDHDITRRSFCRLLDTIAAIGTATETELASGEPMRKGAAVLTFDDGTEDHLWVGEELARRDLRAIFFVPAGRVGRPGFLPPHRVRGLHALGIRIGSHGFDHLCLEKGMPPDAMRRELEDSKKLLEDVGGAPVAYFAPPGGLGSRVVRPALSRYGYLASRSMRWGIYTSWEARWEIPCIPVTEFTLGRGWVTAALRVGAMPLAMRGAWFVKRLMPSRARFAVRRKLHAPFGAGRSRLGP